MQGQQHQKSQQLSSGTLIPPLAGAKPPPDPGPPPPRPKASSRIKPTSRHRSSSAQGIPFHNHTTPYTPPTTRFIFAPAELRVLASHTSSFQAHQDCVSSSSSSPSGPFPSTSRPHVNGGDSGTRTTSRFPGAKSLSSPHLQAHVQLSSLGIESSGPSSTSRPGTSSATSDSPPSPRSPPPAYSEELPDCHSPPITARHVSGPMMNGRAVHNGAYSTDGDDTDIGQEEDEDSTNIFIRPRTNGVGSLRSRIPQHSRSANNLRARFSLTSTSPNGPNSIVHSSQGAGSSSALNYSNRNARASGLMPISAQGSSSPINPREGAASKSMVIPRFICTRPGELGAGETETELDEPIRRLPTSRIIQSTGSLRASTSWQEKLTPLLFEFSRLLAVVPAFFGVLYNLYRLIYRPGARGPERIDFFVSILWALLTGYQALSLTTGLLTRWRIYYQPLSTLIRLLALQAICWPATHFTLKILDVEKRPTAVWAVVGTTTCVSRAVQLWVTSNLWWEGLSTHGAGPDEAGVNAGDERNDSSDSGTATSGTGPSLVKERTSTRMMIAGTFIKRKPPGYWKRWRGGNWGGRRWEWKEVAIKCMFPAGVLYFVMAWADVLRRELNAGC